MINFINEINHENPKDFRFPLENPYGCLLVKAY
jgi:hypothetical protein